jgi:hypothetical protein
MTQTTYNDNVLIDGSQDIKQLRVQGHTTQNQPLQTWEDSAGNVQAQVTGDGRLQVGDDVGLASPDALVEAHRADTSTSKPKRGIHSLGRVSGTLSALVQWMVGELELRGSTAIDALHTALRIRASNMNTGTPTSNAELRAADIEVINDATAGAAALTNATGLQVGVTNASGKTITNAFGLHVKMNNAGTITNPFAIYTEGAGVTHLEDYAEMKRPAAAPGTPATDFIRFYPKSDGLFYAKNWNGSEYQMMAPPSNWSATRPPNTSDDANAGWLVGSRWLDVTGGNEYVCISNTASNAVWKQITEPHVLNGRKWFNVMAAAATVEGIGVATPTLSGALAISNDTDSAYLNFTTSAAAASVAGPISTTFNLVRPGYDPTFIAVLRTGADITNLRLFVGLFPSAPTNADNPPNNSICFRYSALAADGGWRGICRDASAQTVSAQIGPTLAASTKYVLKIRKQGSSVFFSVNNGAETAITTNLPADTTDLGFTVRVITNVAVAKSIKVSRLHCDFN